MKITDVRVRVVHNDLYRPITNSLGRSLAKQREITIVEVMTDAGITGALGSIILDATLRRIMIEQLRPVLIGEDPLRYERVARQMFGMEAQGWRPPFIAGEAVRAMSALDTCVWDIIGKPLVNTVSRERGY